VLGLQPAVEAVLKTRARIPARHSVLVAVSGIDGSGKGYVSALLTDALRERALSAAVVNVDAWLRLPHQRFDRNNPAEHFYLHAIRFEELFATLLLPLREHRSHRVTMDFVEETATAARPHTYDFTNLDVVLVEGIFLLKRALRTHYDLSIWIECGFEKALERALARAQENLGPEDTVRAYESIYFAAQRLHFERDDPSAAATMVIDNG